MRIAIIMDPLEHLDIANDSSLYMARAAWDLGFRVDHVLPESVEWHITRDHSRILARSRQLTPSQKAWDLAAPQEGDLSDYDVVLLRQDPPFDMHYITITHMLEEVVSKRTRVHNHPASVRNFPEKLHSLWLKHHCAPTVVTRSLSTVQSLRRRWGDLVIKPLYGNGGAGVYVLMRGDPNLDVVVETMLTTTREPFMVQSFLPDVRQGDVRAIFFAGELVGAFNRRPLPGSYRSNMHVGGTVEPIVLTEQQLEVCRDVGVQLKAGGIHFAGIDLIGPVLGEINITSPTGLITLEQFGVKDVGRRFWSTMLALDQT